MRIRYLTALVAAVALSSTPNIALIVQDKNMPLLLVAEESPTPEQISAELGAVPPGTPPREAAMILFPGDDEAQQNYLQLTTDLDERAKRVKRGAQALPVALAVYLPLLAKCAVGATTGIVANEMLIAAKRGDNLTVQSIVEGTISGCISGLLPPFATYVASSVKVPLVEAIAAAIIWLSRP